MCGIAAIFSYRDGPPVDQSELLKTRDRMTSRGPDGAGIWISEDRRIGLAHRRLSIIDLSPSGAQPMFDDTRMLAIVFNGEIYNYRELRLQLEKSGFHFKSTSDTEVLLHLYADRGVKMLDGLRGMYAFALWDNYKNALFIARDPYGIKPVYFADDGHTLRVASQVKALLAGGAVDTTPNPAGHVGFFLWGHVPDPHTMYRGIRAVPAGSFLWSQQGQTTREASFCNIPGMFASAQQNGSPKGTLREALRDTVRHHLIADVPVGVFLSSGVDSTTIAALAAEEGGTVQTVTLGFEEYKGTPNDETPLAEAAARAYATKHHTMWITRRDFEGRLEDLFWSMDQPTIDGVNSYWVSRAAQQSGLKVALSGLGGDELFGGYPSFRQIPSLVKVMRPLRPLRPFGRGFRMVSAPLLKRWTSPKYAGLLEYGGSYAGAYLLRRGLFMPWELLKVMNLDMARAGWQELQPIAAIERDIGQIDSPRSTVSCVESCWYMRNQLLRDADWAGMAHSLEIRVPLVDIELLRSARQGMGNGNPPGKRTLAEAPLRPLPAGVLSRPKTGFCVPVREWLLSSVSHDGSVSNSDRGLRAWAKVVYNHSLTQQV
jgi:asparagine synthase (glutamine-hydrolysing)